MMFVRLILFGSLFPLLRQGYHPSQIPPVFTYAFDLEPERFLIQVDVRRVGSTSFYKLGILIKGNHARRTGCCLEQFLNLTNRLRL